MLQRSQALFTVQYVENPFNIFCEFIKLEKMFMMIVMVETEDEDGFLYLFVDIDEQQRNEPRRVVIRKVENLFERETGSEAINGDKRRWSRGRQRQRIQANYLKGRKIADRRKDGKQARKEGSNSGQITCCTLVLHVDHLPSIRKDPSVSIKSKTIEATT